MLIIFSFTSFLMNLLFTFSSPVCEMKTKPHGVLLHLGFLYSQLQIGSNRGNISKDEKVRENNCGGISHVLPSYSDISFMSYQEAPLSKFHASASVTHFSFRSFTLGTIMTSTLPRVSEPTLMDL